MVLRRKSRGLGIDHVACSDGCRRGYDEVRKIIIRKMVKALNESFEVKILGNDTDRKKFAVWLSSVKDVFRALHHKGKSNSGLQK